MIRSRFTVPAALAAALLLAVPAAAHAATPTWRPAETVGGGIGQTPEIAANDDGAGVIAWIADVGGGNAQVLARRFTDDAGPRGEVVNLSGTIPMPPPNISVDRVEVEVQPEGTAVVVWRQADGSVKARPILPVGLAGPVVEVAPAGDSIYGFGLATDVAPNGAVAVAWTGPSSAGQGGQGRIRRIDASGALGPTLPLTPAGAETRSDRWPAAVAADRQGRFWVVVDEYLDSNGDGRIEDVVRYARRLSPDGTSLTARVDLDRHGGLPQTGCQGEAATDTAGRLFAAWGTRGAGPNGGTRGRWVGVDARTLGPVVDLDRTTCAGPDVVVTADGTAVTTWTRPLQAGSAHVLRTVSPAGRLGNERILESGPQFNPAISFTSLATAGANAVGAVWGGGPARTRFAAAPDGALGALATLQGGTTLSPEITGAGTNRWAAAWSVAGNGVQMARTNPAARRAPRMRASVDPDSAGRPLLDATLSGRFGSDPLGAINSVSLQLPSELAWSSAARGRPGRYVVVRAGGRAIPSSALRISGRSLIAQLPAGATGVTITTRSKGLEGTSRLRCPSSVEEGETCLLRLLFRATSVDVSGESSSSSAATRIRLEGG